MKKVGLYLLISFIFGCSSAQQNQYNVMQQTEFTGPVTEKITAKGIVIEVQSNEQIISISHAPIPEMNWPPMLMKFKVEKRVSLDKFDKGDRVMFDLDIDAEQNFRVSDIRMQ